MICIGVCTRWNIGGQWTSSSNMVRMRIAIKWYFTVFTCPVSPEAKKEIEELDAKEAEGDKIQEGTELK